MKLFLCLAALVALYCSVDSIKSPPKVQVYTRDPGEYGKENTLICRLSNFHPPDVTVEILKDGKEIGNAHQSDLAFGQDWHFHLSKHVSFTPQKGEHYTCRVTHGDTHKVYSWEPNM